MRLLDTFEMQRLRGIQQLGNVSLVYPSATHTRFDHSLGTRWLVQKIVRISKLPLTKNEERILCLAALLHDVAEPCLPHVLERRLDLLDFPAHEEVARNIFDGTYRQKAREKLDQRQSRPKPVFVADLLDNETADAICSIICRDAKDVPHPYLRELVNGPIDADTLDYLARDSYFCGLPYGAYDDRIFACYRIATVGGANHILFRKSNDAINAILSILNSRLVLRKAAYSHHTVLIADDMFFTSLQNAQADHVIDGYDIFLLRQDEILTKILNDRDPNSGGIKSSEKAGELAERIRNRQLFKRAYVLEWPEISKAQTKIERLQRDVSEFTEFKDAIARESDLELDDLLVTVPTKSGWKEDYKDIPLMEDTGDRVTLGTARPVELSLLKDKFEQLATAIVSAKSPEVPLRIRVNQACTRYFGTPGTYWPRLSVGDGYDVAARTHAKLQSVIELHNGASKVLQVLLRDGKPLTREDIAASLQISPSTVSYYLTQIMNELSASEVKALIVKRESKKKFWQVRPEILSAYARGVSSNETEQRL